MKFFTFIAEFFQDQDGSASSKRIGAYVLLWYLGRLVTASIEGKVIDKDVLWMVTGLLGLSLGLITTEFISKFKNNKEVDKQ